MSKKSYIMIFLSIITLFTLTGCTFPWQKKKVAPVTINYNNASSTVTTTSDGLVGDIKKFKSLDDLQAFLIQNPNLNNQSSGPVSTKTSSPVNPQVPLTDVKIPDAGGADIMKTDGTYVYFLDYSDLYIYKTAPASDAGVITKITFKSRPKEFYVSGDRLVIFGYDDQIYNNATYQSFKRQSAFTYVKVFDVSDPKNPKQIRDLNFEGNYVNSRLVGDYLYFITSNYQNYLESEPLLPRILDNGQVLSEKCSLSSKCLNADIFYFNVPYQSYSFNSVSAINLKNPSEPISDSVYLLTDNQSLYVSPNNIYITYTDYLDEAEVERDVTTNLIQTKLSAADQDRVTKIQAVDNFILSETEKKDKIYALVKDYIAKLSNEEKKVLQLNVDAALKQTLETKAKEIEKTVIHKIAFSGPKLEYLAGGVVPGRILSPSSMDENNGYFRIATSMSQSWSKLVSATNTNNVYILDDKLKTVGTLENVAPGEQIYSARFTGDRAYLITFKPNEPLFAVDLKDPKAPQILGALKTPGYLTYFEPYAGNLWLGFGRDTETSASGSIKNKGLKLSLFDFTIPGAPLELDSFITGDEYSSSIALSDHKALLVASDKNLVVFPATLRGGDSGSRVEFSGALAFSITDNKIKLRGRIDHSDGGNYTHADSWEGFNYFDNSVKRSLYNGDSLFTLSNKFLRINDLSQAASDLSPLKMIDLLPNLNKDFEVPPVEAPLLTPEAGLGLNPAIATDSASGTSPDLVVPVPTSTEAAISSGTDTSSSSTLSN
ncbi:MAG: beta-propeller domain-containing protein [Candidatus Falkowbacteria bacterium]